MKRARAADEQLARLVGGAPDLADESVTASRQRLNTHLRDNTFIQ
jgi:hypothetical protein